MKKKLLFLGCLVFLLLFSAQAFSITQEINFQGRLLNSSGEPIVSTSTNVDFRMYDVPTGGSQLWWINRDILTNEQGVFNTTLPIGAYSFDGGDRWIEVVVEGNLLLPRQKITTVPYAYRAITAESVVGLTPGNYVSRSGDTMTGDLLLNYANLKVFGGSLEVGYSNAANGQFSFAGGSDTLASGYDSIAYGRTCNAYGDYSAAFGFSSYANGGSVAFGGSNAANGENAIVTGSDSLANGKYSVAMGYQVSAGGERAIAMGWNSTAAGIASLAIGSRASSLHNGSMVFTDAVDEDFPSTTNDQFLVRAHNGMGVNTNETTSALTVNGTIETIGTGGIKFPDMSIQTTAATAGAFSGAYVQKAGDTMNGVLSIEGTTSGTMLNVNNQGNGYAVEVTGGNIGSGGGKGIRVNASSLVGSTGVSIEAGGGQAGSVINGLIVSATGGNGAGKGIIVNASGRASTGISISTTGGIDAAGKGIYIADPGDQNSGIYAGGVNIDASSNTAQDGVVFKGTQSGTSGYGLYLTLSNASNTRDAIYVSNSGSGYSAHLIGGRGLKVVGSLEVGDNSVTASGQNSFAFGETVVASGHRSFAGGAGVTASGQESMVFGMTSNASAAYSYALGVYSGAGGSPSFALGFRALSPNKGSFVYSDRSNETDFFSSKYDDQFLIRAVGGVGIGTNETASSALTVKGTIETIGTGGIKFPSGTQTEPYLGGGGGGMSTAEADAKYVFKAGDTMTGTITLAASGKALELNNPTFVIHAPLITAGYPTLNRALYISDAGQATAELAGDDQTGFSGIYYGGRFTSRGGYQATNGMQYGAGAMVEDTAGYFTGEYGSSVGLLYTHRDSGIITQQHTALFKGNNVKNVGSFESGDANAMATGMYSTAFGVSNEAKGYASLVAGGQSTASGMRSIAMGDNCSAAGAGGIALGRYSTAGDINFSYAIGNYVTATGLGAMAIGFRGTAEGTSSIAIGPYAQTGPSANNSIAVSVGSAVVPIVTQPNIFAIQGGNVVIGTSEASNGNKLEVVRDADVGSSVMTVRHVPATNSSLLKLKYDTAGGDPNTNPQFTALLMDSPTGRFIQGYKSGNKVFEVDHNGYVTIANHIYKVGSATNFTALNIDYTPYNDHKDTSYGIKVNNVGASSGDPGPVYGIYDEISGSGAPAIGLYVNTVSPGVGRYAALFDQGNIGMGTLTPEAKLHVVGNVIMTGGRVVIGSTEPTTALRVEGTIETTGTGGIKFPTGTQTEPYLGGAAVGGWTAGSGKVYVTNISDKVGIGTTAPGATLTVKGSLEVGLENVAIGNYSVAMGYQSIARGNFIPAYAFGYGAVASAGSMAIGSGTSANGAYSLAVGRYSTADGTCAMAQGDATHAYGSSSVAMGSNTLASADNCFAMGYYSTAGSPGKMNAVAIGDEARAFGYDSMAIGYMTTAKGDYSTAIGSYTTAEGMYSTAIGRKINAKMDYTLGIGLDDTARSINQPNTMAIMGGNVGIGTTEPTATFEVKGTVKMFGAVQSKSYGTTYEAETDGFVVAYFQATGASETRVTGYSDSNANPVAKRAVVSMNAAYSIYFGGFTMPVRKGDKWFISTDFGSLTGSYITWVPLGQ